MVSHVNSTKHSKKNEYLSFLNYFKKLKKEERFYTHSIKPALPWHQKQAKTLQANILDKQRCKNSQQNTSK